MGVWNISAGPGSAAGAGNQRSCPAAESSGVAYSWSNVSAALAPPVRSDQIHSDQVAKPSLSQMSGQTSSVTESPHHMWAISWTTVASLGTRQYIGFVCDSSE